jgi:hypothetical protein
MAGDEDVVVRTFINLFDAEVAQTALDAAGIESRIRADDCGGLRPHLQLGGVALLVRPHDVIRAEQVLTAEAEVLVDDEE